MVELSVYCMEESARCYRQLGQSNQCIVTCTNVLALYPQHLEGKHASDPYLRSTFDPQEPKHRPM